jgi:dienelactone hydrolase
MKKWQLVSLISLSAIALLLLFRVLEGVSDFELARHPADTHRFNAAGNRIEGTLTWPTGVTDPPVVAIVHGDGPQTRWSDGGYLPLVNALLDSGIGVFSWDKPGVGASTGNWLDQSMEDRAEEAVAALSYLRETVGLHPDRLGFLGFSQAGWVIPEANLKAQHAFSVLVGAAINWRLQGAYYTRRRLQLSGYPEEEIDRFVEAELAENDAVFGPQSSANGKTRTGISPARLAFARRNYHADAAAAIAKMKGPILAVWGDGDLNVDPERSIKVYREALESSSLLRVEILPDATHGLLRAGLYNYQLAEDWPVWTTICFVLSGRRAFAPEAIELISGWIHKAAS